MSFYNIKLKSNDSFQERIGEAEEFDAAIGRIVQSFSGLEISIKNVISIFLGIESDIAKIITEEMSFKNLISLLSSLFKYKYMKDNFNNPEIDIEKMFKELMSLCNNSEVYRNKIIHSQYVLKKYCVKTTSKMKKGLNTNIEEINADYLLDISDYISETSMCVEEFPMFLGISDFISGNGISVGYYKNKEVIAYFEYINNQSQSSKTNSSESSLAFDLFTSGSLTWATFGLLICSSN
ncbi:hypothetical protein [Sulfurimonas sp. CS5]|uniref:hypothetical protein n=1 Tax=Sulfurimonas sp. CS5 TaxID=3391145 RepID=UPI0039EAFE62